jgi:hypothetical protein
MPAAIPAVSAPKELQKNPLKIDETQISTNP